MLIVPADPAVHGRWIFSTFCSGAGEPRETLHRLLRTGAARAAVMQTEADASVFASWAAVISNQQTICWTYTKPLVRRRGHMVALLDFLGVDTTQPMYALFPSPALLGLIRKGWPITIAPKERTHEQHDHQHDEAHLPAG